MLFTTYFNCPDCKLPFDQDRRFPVAGPHTFLAKFNGQPRLVRAKNFDEFKEELAAKEDEIKQLTKKLEAIDAKKEEDRHTFLATFNSQPRFVRAKHLDKFKEELAAKDDEIKELTQKITIVTGGINVTEKVKTVVQKLFEQWKSGQRDELMVYIYTDAALDPYEIDGYCHPYGQRDVLSRGDEMLLELLIYPQLSYMGCFFCADDDDPW
ncbi:unnamed protein product, partial [Mesorhabditis spiculigera]